MFAFFLPARGIWHYFQLRPALVSGRVARLDGEVKKYRPNTQGQFDRFSVCGKRFTIDPEEKEPGLTLVRSNGSPIRARLPVRISYVGDRIVHLEVCRPNHRSAC